MTSAANDNRSPMGVIIISDRTGLECRTCRGPRHYLPCYTDRHGVRHVFWSCSSPSLGLAVSHAMLVFRSWLAAEQIEAV